MVPLVERKNCHIDHTIFTWIARKVSVNVLQIDITVYTVHPGQQQQDSNWAFSGWQW